MSPMPEAAAVEAKTQPPLSYSGALARALLDPHAPAPACVAGPGKQPAGRRFDVYRNNVTFSLVNALAETYPAVQRLVGKDFFAAMARLHVRASPPTSPLLFEYGRDFPAFIDEFEPARQLPWLGDVARVERAWLDAYHAADAGKLTPQQLSSLSPEALEAARFVAHPATRIVRSAYPAVSIFAANRDETGDGSVEAEGAEDALITRPELAVMVRWLPAGGAEFLQYLVAGGTLGEAAQAAGQVKDFDLAVNIEGLLSSGAFSAVVA